MLLHANKMPLETGAFGNAGHENSPADCPSRTHTRRAVSCPLSEALGGHATLFRGQDKQAVFSPSDPISLGIQRKLKAAFDPANIFNRGRLGDL